MNTANPAHDTLRIHVSSMSCAACVRRVERVLTRIDGVSGASVNLATEEALVVGTELDQLTASLLNALEAAGYPGRIIEPQQQQESSSRDIGTETESTHRLELRALRKRLIWSFVFTTPLFLLSMAPMLWTPLMDMMMLWLPMTSWNLIALLLCMPVQFWIGAPFYRNGIKSLLAGSPDMNTLVLLGTNAAFGYSLVATFLPNWLPPENQHVYYESSAVVISLVLLGKYLESRARGEATRAMQGLLELQPKIATVYRNGQWMELDVSQVHVGELIEIKPGSSIPLDSVVEDGGSYVDESMLTGEPIPASKLPGDKVIGGTMNGNGRLQCRVLQSASGSTLARIVDSVRAAQSAKPQIQSLADQVVAYFVPVVLCIALATLLGWWLGSQGGIEAGMIHAATVLIVACPCAMGLAVPISIMVASGTAARKGVLFRNGQAIQSLAGIHIVALDKTGTITEGKPVLHEFVTLGDYSKTEALNMLAALQSSSEHPMAIAVLEAAKAQGISYHIPIQNFRALPGLGLEGTLPDGRTIAAGSERFVREKNIALTQANPYITQWERIGASWFFVAVDNNLVALVAVTDTIKPSAIPCIQFLKEHGIEPLLVSGDHAAAVNYIAHQVGIAPQNLHASCSPTDKSEVLRTRSSQGKRLAFVGDGINDSLALSCADVGVAIGTGTDLAIESADVVLMRGDLISLCHAWEMASAALRNIKQNLLWAFGYNIILIPIATGMFQPMLGISFSPMLGALAMSLSSFFVVTNALRLRNVRFFQAS
ncbi:heavy metal translocating P-type ATPase [Pirellulaceae bacterium SH449]